MRTPKGALLPPIRPGRLRRGDLYALLRAAVLDSVLPPGARLPSTRQAAADYGVSRGLLEEIYAQLTEEGFLERAVGRGTFVAGAIARLPTAHSVAKLGLQPSRRGRRVSAMAACREPETIRPFNAGLADTRYFPWRIWHRLEARAARELGPQSLGFSDPRGLPQLRAAVARHLAQFRGIRCAPGQIAIFNSAQQAIHALALLLLNPGDRVWMENPGYPGARAALELGGARIVPVPIDDQGVRVDRGIDAARRARLAYVTPSHQYPTGVALSLARRFALLEWAGRSNAWIIEDDYDGDFRYEGQPVTALYSLDSGGRVLYLGTLNKSMFVSLRLAYAVLPEDLMEALANIRTQLDGFTPPVRQMAMALFMDEGYFPSHLRRMRMLYAAKRAQLIETLAPLRARGWSWPDNPAGLHLLISHRDPAYVSAVVAKSQLELARLGSYRSHPARGDGLLLRYGGLDEGSLEAGAAQLVRAALTVNASTNDTASRARRRPPILLPVRFRSCADR